MSKLMLILGIIMAAFGLALGVMVFSSPAQLQVWGITPETAATLFTGGVLAMGLGGVISALASGSIGSVAVADAVPAAEAFTHEEIPPSTPAVVEAAVAEIPAPEAVSAPKKGLFGFGRKTAEVVAAGAAVGAVAEAAIPANKSVAETLEALEQAKAELKASVGLPATPAPATTAPAIAVPEIPEVIEEAAEIIEEDVAADGEADLYVVEEQVVRGHAARVLSDGTVEAETSEGWMRFENLEHLNEYLDATENA